MKGVCSRVASCHHPPMARMARGWTARHAVFAMCWAGALGFGVLSMAIADSGPELTASRGWWAPGIAAGWSLIAVGLYVSRRDRGEGLLFAAAGVAWFAAEWNHPAAPGSAALTFGLV